MERKTIGIKEIRAIPVGGFRAFAVVDYSHARSIISNCNYFNKAEGEKTGVKVKASINSDVVIITKSSTRQ